MSASSLRRRLGIFIAALAIIALPSLTSRADDATAVDNDTPTITDSSAPSADATTAPEAQSPAQLASPLAIGDVAVTGFSGVSLATATVPAGTDPAAETVIDPDGISLRIFDLSNLGGPMAAQVVDAPVLLAVPAGEIGQVFGVTFDNGGGQGGTGVPNLYVAASSAYGLQIVGAPDAAGAVTRLKQGAPGAQFMAGQFGGLPGGSPGAIYRIDGTTGAVSLAADTAFSGVPNTGAGIGNLALDPQSQSLYASDLDTGLIHHFDLAHNGADLGQFDQGVAGRPSAGLASVADDGKIANIGDPGFNPADPATWGFTQAERRVEALAVHEGRLYYSVADGPTVWSVGLQPDGSFGSDPRIELQVSAAQPFAVTDITFDAEGRMILAQRGTQQGPFDYSQFTTPGAAETLRFAPIAPTAGSSSLWAPDPEEYAIGLPQGSRQGTGGVTLINNYDQAGVLGQTCRQTLITTGDDLRDNPALPNLPPGVTNLHGIQLNDASQVEPANNPPLLSAFVQFDANQADPQASGYVGDVEAVPCLASPPAQSAAPGLVILPPLGGPGSPFPLNNPSTGLLTLTKVPAATSCTTDGGCKFTILVNNPGPDPVPGPFTIDDVFTAGGALLGNATLADDPTPPWTCAAGAGGQIACTDPGPLPVGTTALELNFTPGDVGRAGNVLNCVRPDDPANPPLILNAQPGGGGATTGTTASGGGNATTGTTTAAGAGTATGAGGPNGTVAATGTGAANGTAAATGTATAATGAANGTAVATGTAIVTTTTTATGAANATGGANGTAAAAGAGTGTAKGGVDPLDIGVRDTAPAAANAGHALVHPLAAPGTAAANAPAATNGAPGATTGTTTTNGQATATGQGPAKGGQAGNGDTQVTQQFPPQQCASIPLTPPKKGGGTTTTTNPGGGGTTTATNPGGGGTIKSTPVTVGGVTWQKEGPATCTDTGECTFTIHVQNNNTQGVPGPLKVTDSLSNPNATANGQPAFLHGAVISTPPSPPWTCTPLASAVSPAPTRTGWRPAPRPISPSASSSTSTR